MVEMCHTLELRGKGRLTTSCAQRDKMFDSEVEHAHQGAAAGSDHNFKEMLRLS